MATDCPECVRVFCVFRMFAYIRCMACAYCFDDDVDDTIYEGKAYYGFCLGSPSFVPGGKILLPLRVGL